MAAPSPGPEKVRLPEGRSCKERKQAFRLEGLPCNGNGGCSGFAPGFPRARSFIIGFMVAHPCRFVKFLLLFLFFKRKMKLEFVAELGIRN